MNRFFIILVLSVFLLSSLFVGGYTIGRESLMAQGADENWLDDEEWLDEDEPTEDTDNSETASAPVYKQAPEAKQAPQAKQAAAYPDKKYYSGSRTFVFNPRAHKWYAYSNGVLVASGVAAGGAHYCKDIKRSCRTPTGVFRVVRKGPADCRSTRYPRPYGGARMDYCMFFTRYYAIHGSQSVPAANVSHGCIRVRPEAARWLHAHFMQVGTRVVVMSY